MVALERAIVAEAVEMKSVVAIVAIALLATACQGGSGPSPGPSTSQHDWFGPSPDRFVRTGPHGDP
jgi:hypothetical protein